MILKPIKNIDFFGDKAEPNIGVFGSKKWLSIYKKQLELVGIYKDEHQLIGGFYFLKTKKYGFTFIKLPPYTPHCGLFFLSESKNKSSINNFSKEVMHAICDYMMQQKSSLTILAFPYQIKDFQPFIWRKFKVIPNYTYHINLTNSLETIISNFDSKNRNVINKAIKEDVTVIHNGVDNDELYRFFANSLAAADANIYKQELASIFFEFANESNSFALIAKKDTVFLGAVFCVYDLNACYYMFGGVAKNSGISGINNLLIQKSIEKAKELGCKVFDFEGSMLKGVEKFFRSFGPELTPYYTINKGSLPLEIILKHIKREIF